jgi:hypothetical protein
MARDPLVDIHIIGKFLFFVYYETSFAKLVESGALEILGISGTMPTQII